jgi:hypothetical protein
MRFSWDPQKDAQNQRDHGISFQEASTIFRDPLTATIPDPLVVHPSVTASTAPELLQYVSRNKGKLSYGSYGLGAYPHLAGAYMSDSQKADMAHVPYKDAHRRDGVRAEGEHAGGIRCPLQT